MKLIFQPRKSRLWALLGMLLLIGGLSGGSLYAQSAHPDSAYPIPDNHRSADKGGVNLMTGDLNLDFSLKGISGRGASYTIDLFYNSKSADLSAADNAVGGHGWKLMDYPKIVKDSSDYYYLDGQRRYKLKADARGYHTDAPYHLRRFAYQADRNVWVIQTEHGTDYELANTSEEGDYTFYHLSQKKGRNWGDALQFTYSGGNITAITSSLGDFLQIKYDNNGHLTTIRRNSDGIIRHETVLDYTAGRLSSVKELQKLPTGLFIGGEKARHFHYDAAGRINELVAPSGVVQQYTYDNGAVYPELAGKVIRYSIDSGFPVNRSPEDTPVDANPDAVYSAIWYDLNNSRLGDDAVYRFFNKVRVYPGGFYEASDYDDFGVHHNPFGHESYYFFHGQPQDSLSAIPEGFDGSVDVTDASLTGKVYCFEQYTGKGVAEQPEHRVGINKYFYALENSHHAVNPVNVPLQKMMRATKDDVEEQTIWHEYDNPYLLPTATITSRRNPTPEEPGKKEYAKNHRRYACLDYPMLDSLYLLTKVTQQYNAVTTYSGDTPYTDISGDDWQVGEASFSSWTPWGEDSTSRWAENETYTLQQQLKESDFPLDIGAAVDAQGWLRTSRTSARDAFGKAQTSQGKSGATDFKLYSNNKRSFPIATFRNANVGTRAVGYLGFEAYESRRHWRLSNGKNHYADAHTGSKSLRLDSGDVQADFYPTRSGTAYLFGAFVKNAGGPAILGFQGKDSVDWQDSVTIASSDAWVYYQIVTDSASYTSLPTLECSDCLVDDIRFHPLSMPFSATVYRGLGASEYDTLTVDRPGDYDAGYRVTLADETTIAPEQNLTVKAGRLITFGQEVSIKPGAEMRLSLTHEKSDRSRVATLGGNGETSQQVYDASDRMIATEGPAGSVRSLNLRYDSRKGMACFGDSDPDDPYFDQNHPHETLNITPREKSVLEAFQWPAAGRFTDLSGVAVEEGLLKVTSSSGSATFSTPLTASDYALHVEALPNERLTGQLGLQIGDIRLIVGRSKLALEQRVGTAWNELEKVMLRQRSAYLHLTLIVMDGKYLSAYADGRFLFSYASGEALTGTVKLTAENAAGSAFDNFMCLGDVQVSKQASDASGQVQQRLVQQAPNELLVTQELYGDALGLPIATTLETYISAESGDVGLGYRPGFAQLSYLKDDLGRPTLSVSGEVQEKHGHDTPFASSTTYTAEPVPRLDRTGRGGAFTAGTGYDTKYQYTYDSTAGPSGFEAGSVRSRIRNVPFDADTSNYEMAHQKYSGAGRTVFGSAVTDRETGTARKQQVSYDARMRPQQQASPGYFEGGHAGLRTQVAYDCAGNVAYERDPDEGVVQHIYDRAGRLRALLDEAGTRAIPPYFHYWKYDREGRIAEEGLYEQNEGEEANVVINLEYPDLSSTSDTTLHVPGIILVDSAGADYTGHLDLKAGQRISLEFGFSVSVDQDQTLQAELAGGCSSGTSFNARIQALTEPQAWPSADDPHRKVKRAYRYDRDRENPTNPAVGRMVSVTTYNAAGEADDDYTTRHHTYNLKGQVTRIAQEMKEGEAALTDAFDYHYDERGRLVRMVHDTTTSSFPVDYDIHYTYDRLGRLSSIGHASNKAAYARYTYGNGGYTETLGNTDSTYAAAVRYAINAEGLPDTIRAEKQDGTLLFEEKLYFTERRDGSEGYYNGLVAGVSYTSGASVRHYDYDYDRFGQLVRRTEGTDSIHYMYDANGNLLDKAGQPYRYRGGTNRVTEAQGVAYRYDPAGRVAATIEGGDTTTYAYAPFTGLTQRISLPTGDSIRYAYGTADERIKKTVGDATLRYFRGLDSYPLIETVITDADTVYYTYIYGRSGLLAVTKQHATADDALRYTATMEPENASLEESIFANLEATRTIHPLANHTTGGTHTAELNAARRVGPLLMLPVSAGDSISLETWAYYPDEPGAEVSSSVPLALADQVAAAFGGTNGGGEVPQRVFNGLSTAVAALAAQHDNDRTAGPKAYLNYLLFDEDLRYVDGGFVAATEASEAAPERLEVASRPVANTGYLYTYLSYEGRESRSVYFDELAVAHSLSTDIKYVVKDHLRSTRALANTSGEVVARYDYDAFGEEVAHSPSSTEMRYLYTGQEYDPETDLYNYRARLYNPELGRFYAPDPAGEQNSAYAYVRNNPISYNDPNGETAEETVDNSLVIDGETYDIVIEFEVEFTGGDGSDNFGDIESGNRNLGEEEDLVSFTYGGLPAEGFEVPTVLNVTGGCTGCANELGLSNDIQGGSDVIYPSSENTETERRHLSAESIEESIEENSRSWSWSWLSASEGCVATVAADWVIATAIAAPSAGSSFVAEAILTIPECILGGIVGGLSRDQEEELNENVEEAITESIGGSSYSAEAFTVTHVNTRHRNFNNNGEGISYPLISTCLEAGEGEGTRPEGVEKVNGRWPINSQYAGRAFPLPDDIAGTYPGFSFKSTGYPDFSPWKIAEVDIGCLHQSSLANDFRRANEEAGYSSTPSGHTWHHVEYSTTLQLVPTDLHRAARHTGGRATMDSGNTCSVEGIPAIPDPDSCSCADQDD